MERQSRFWLGAILLLTFTLAGMPGAQAEEEPSSTQGGECSSQEDPGAENSTSSQQCEKHNSIRIQGQDVNVGMPCDAGVVFHGPPRPDDPTGIENSVGIKLNCLPEPVISVAASASNSLP